MGIWNYNRNYHCPCPQFNFHSSPASAFIDLYIKQTQSALSTETTTKLKYSDISAKHCVLLQKRPQ